MCSKHVSFYRNGIRSILHSNLDCSEKKELLLKYFDFIRIRQTENYNSANNLLDYSNEGKISKSEKKPNKT